MTWWGWIATGIGALVLLSQGIDALKNIFSPVLNMEERLKTVEEHDKTDLGRFEKVGQQVSAVNTRVDEMGKNMEARFAKQEETNQAILQSLAALINHEIDGNGIDGLKKARTELLQHIITR